MILCLTFDDGRLDNYKAHLLLKKFNLAATFFITTGFVDKTFTTDVFGAGRQPLSIDNIVEMKNNGMEIASHGDRHMMEHDDFVCSYKKIFKWLSESPKKIGFSIPNSKFKGEELRCFCSKNINAIDYIRKGRNEKCYTLKSKMLFALNRIFGFQFAYNSFNKQNLFTNIRLNRFGIPSIVVKRSTRLRNVISFLNKYSKTNSIAVLMFHSIVNDPKDDWEWSLDNFTSLCSYLSDNAFIDVKTLSMLVERGTDF